MANSPPNDASMRAAIAQLCDKYSGPVVLITSGGTTVPLEQNMVRFLDNFRYSFSQKLLGGYSSLEIKRRSSFYQHFAYFWSITFTWVVRVDDSRGERGAASVECFIAQGMANNWKLSRRKYHCCKLLLVVIPNFNVIFSSGIWFAWHCYNVTWQLLRGHPQFNNYPFWIAIRIICHFISLYWFIILLFTFILFF